MGKCLSYKRTMEDKVVIKGELSKDCTTIHVVDKDFERDVVLKDYLDEFAETYVEITLKNKSEEDLLYSDEEQVGVYYF